MPVKSRQLIYVFLVVALLFVSTEKICPQQAVIDSLENILKNDRLSGRERLKTLNRLAACYIAEGRDGANELADSALNLAGGVPDIALKLPAYTNKASVLEMKDSIQAAYYMIDTCMQYIAELGDVADKAKALLRVAKIKHGFQDESDILPLVFEALDIAKKTDDKAIQVSVYHFLANSYYGQLADMVNVRKYAELACEAAKDLADSNEKALAYLSMGYMYRSVYVYGERNKDTGAYLDSAITYIKKSAALSDCMEGYIPVSTNLNSLGQLLSTYSYQTFVRNDSTFYLYPDSILKYSGIMLEKAMKANDKYNIVGAYLFLSGYESNRKNFAKAEDILVDALEVIKNSESNNKLLRSKYMLCLSLVYQLRITGKYEKALEYMEEAYRYQNNLFQKKYIRDGQISEAKYRLKEKEHALALSEKDAKRHKQLLAGGVIGAVMLLSFLFIYYQMRLKNVKQNAELQEKENEEIRLHALIKENELQRLESEKKTLALEKELEKERAEKQGLEISRLQAELIAGISQLDQKSDTIEKIQKTIEENKQIGQDDIKDILLNDRMAGKSYENFSDLLQRTHPGFFSKLQDIAGNKLTALDLKYCTYILMNFSSKEIANILHVEPKTARSTKYRLKLKLNLSKEDDLASFIKEAARK